MIELYIKSRHRLELVARKFREKFGRKPAKSTIQSIYRKFKETGSINNRKRSWKPSRKLLKYLEIIEECCDKIMTQPEMVQHFATHGIEISRWTICRILKKAQIRKYVIKRMLHLDDQNYIARSKFAEWVMEQLEKDPEFLYKIIFTDEAAVSIHDEFTKTNRRYYGRAPPNFGQDQPHRTPKLQIFVALNIIYGVLYYDFFITNEIKSSTEKGEHSVIRPVTITGDNYETLLRNFKIATQKIDLNELWFQQDGASPHTYGPVKKLLKEMFGERIIGRGFENSWPSKSPDLSVLDYFFWGRLRKIINLTRFCDAKTAILVISDAIESFDIGGIINAILGFKGRAQLCGVLNGRPIRGPIFPLSKMNELNKKSV